MTDKLKVYLETSFVNYLTGRSTSNVKIASEQAYTRQWWETERGKCEVFVSGYTIAESESGGPEYVEKHMANPHTLPKTRAIVSAAGYVCPAVMTPETFIKNTQLEV